jgi:hypothetical protein
MHRLETRQEQRPKLHDNNIFLKKSMHPEFGVCKSNPSTVKTYMKMVFKASRTFFFLNILNQKKRKKKCTPAARDKIQLQF